MRWCPIYLESLPLPCKKGSLRRHRECFRKYAEPLWYNYTIMEKVRVRFGVKVPIFKNAGIFVRYISKENYDLIKANLEKLEATLLLSGDNEAYAMLKALVFEKS